MRNEELARCEFLAGDWQSLHDQQQHNNNKVDVILTSDTIYNSGAQEKLLRYIVSQLDLTTSHGKQHSVAYVAAKSYYFGVGGSTKQFIDLVEKLQNELQVSIKCEKKLVDGNSNVREILAIRSIYHKSV